MGPNPPVPFYLDWPFWTALAAFVSILLSQIPHLRTLFRQASLIVEPSERLAITEKIGNANATQHLYIRNRGGRQVSVVSMTLHLTPESGEAFTLPAQWFYPVGRQHDALLATRFALSPDQEWIASVVFFAPFGPTEERRVRQLTLDLRKDIRRGLSELPEDARKTGRPVEAEPSFVAPLLAFYEQRTRWKTGEYKAELRVVCEPARASLARRFRFTLFESDVAELRDAKSKFKTGFGVCFDDAEAAAVYPGIRELE